MLLRLSNQPRDYAWGSKTLIPKLLGVAADGSPQAEIWFGTHPADPADLDPAIASARGGTLDLMLPKPLSILVKFLAAGQPLSIQAHPTRERARQMFQQENELGLALDDPKRNYRDPNHKPEILIAVTDFEALSGFRSAESVLGELEPHHTFAENQFFAALRDGGIEAAMRQAFATETSEVESLVNAMIGEGHARGELLMRLSLLHPGDQGLLVSVLLNHVLLKPAEAVYLPAGNVHAYIAGLGVEVMAASDNVLRGGLTKKHIDVEELLTVADFNVLTEPRVRTNQLQSGVTEYLTGDAEFATYRIEPNGQSLLLDFEERSEMLVVCVSGSLKLSTNRGDLLLIDQGEGAYVSDDIRVLSVKGNGFGYLARQASAGS